MFVSFGLEVRVVEVSLHCYISCIQYVFESMHLATCDNITWKKKFSRVMIAVWSSLPRISDHD
jgi:hypothetical protein